MTYIPPFDAAVRDWFLGVHTGFLTHFFTIVAFFGAWPVVLPLVVLLCVVFYTTPLQKYIVPFLATVVTAEITTFVLKLLIARPRPLGALVVEHDYSFPSGHATLAAAFYGFLTYIAYRQIRNKMFRSLVMVLGISMILLIGLCRLYLGVHFLSDIIAGYMVGLLGILIGFYVGNRSFKP